jgi:hypothetical protein
MRLVWIADETASAVRKRLADRGLGAIAAALPADEQWRFQRRFPLLIDASGDLVTEAFRFLFDVGVIRGSTRSPRTLETYGERLCDWLTFAERAQLPWRRPSSVMLAMYRDHLLGTRFGEARCLRPLSRRTVNLRITVAIEFYKLLAELPELDPDIRLVVGKRLSQFRRLRVRLDRRRPRAVCGAGRCASTCVLSQRTRGALSPRICISKHQQVTQSDGEAGRRSERDSAAWNSRLFP